MSAQQKRGDGEKACGNASINFVTVSLVYSMLCTSQHSTPLFLGQNPAAIQEEKEIRRRGSACYHGNKNKGQKLISLQRGGAGGDVRAISQEQRSNIPVKKPYPPRNWSKTFDGSREPLGRKASGLIEEQIQWR
jgi:hypothetical protein